MSILFAATYPEPTRALVLYGGYAVQQSVGYLGSSGQDASDFGRLLDLE